MAQALNRGPGGPSATDWPLDASGQAIGPLRLGMSRDDVERILGTQFTPFRRTPDSRDETRAFDDHAVQVIVDRGNQVRGVVVCAPNTVTFAGIPLLGQDVDVLRDALAARGHAFATCDAGLWSQAMGVCLVDVDGRIDAVEIGSPS